VMVPVAAGRLGGLWSARVTRPPAPVAAPET